MGFSHETGEHLPKKGHLPRFVPRHIPRFGVGCQCSLLFFLVLMALDLPMKKAARWSSLAAFRCPNGADDRNRTGDLLVTSELLYQLSYIGAASALFLTHGAIVARNFGRQKGYAGYSCQPLTLQSPSRWSNGCFTVNARGAKTARFLAEMTPWNLIKVMLAQGSVMETPMPGPPRLHGCVFTLPLPSIYKDTRWQIFVLTNPPIPLP